MYTRCDEFTAREAHTPQPTHTTHAPSPRDRAARVPPPTPPRPPRPSELRARRRRRPPRAPARRCARRARRYSTDPRLSASRVVVVCSKIAISNCSKVRSATRSLRLLSVSRVVIAGRSMAARTRRASTPKRVSIAPHCTHVRRTPRSHHDSPPFRRGPLPCRSFYTTALHTHVSCLGLPQTTAPPKVAAANDERAKVSARSLCPAAKFGCKARSFQADARRCVCGQRLATCRLDEHLLHVQCVCDLIVPEVLLSRATPVSSVLAPFTRITRTRRG